MPAKKVRSCGRLHASQLHFVIENALRDHRPSSPVRDPEGEGGARRNSPFHVFSESADLEPITIIITHPSGVAHVSGTYPTQIIASSGQTIHLDGATENRQSRLEGRISHAREAFGSGLSSNSSTERSEAPAASAISQADYVQYDQMRQEYGLNTAEQVLQAYEDSLQLPWEEIVRRWRILNSHPSSPESAATATTISSYTR
eukprot:ANDGO_02567.mRNA.1 hypothetical protein